MVCLNLGAQTEDLHAHECSSCSTQLTLPYQRTGIRYGCSISTLCTLNLHRSEYRHFHISCCNNVICISKPCLALTRWNLLNFVQGTNLLDFVQGTKCWWLGYDGANVLKILTKLLSLSHNRAAFMLIELPLMT